MNILLTLRRCGALIALLFLAAGWLSAPASAQSVDAVINEMKERQRQQLEAVDTYIIETNKYTSYHRKTTRNGETVYETQMKWKEDQGLFSGASSTPSLQPGLAQLDTLAQHATYDGTATIDERQAHVLLVDDPSALSARPMPETEGQPEEGQMRLYVDAERYVPLRMEYDVTVEQEGQPQTIRPRVSFSDYRTVDGLTLPWHMEMKMENLNASISPEEREQARQSLEQMEKKMQEMPEKQRKMMEGMMKSQLDQLRKIIEEGTIEYTVEVQDVKVNAEIPDGIFSDSAN